MVGNFKLSKRIGSGGMGAVYEGVHPIIGSRVAVKLLGGSFALDRDLVERFFAEARTLNQVAHENIVKVIDLGAHSEGFYYCVMELLEGETFSLLILRGRTEIARAVGLLIQACDALEAAHEKGIVHRDLKPANIMLVRSPATGGELVKLVDFGIAKLQSAAQVQTHQTVAGTVIGTPAYMSPEQASGRINEIDPRSDLYSLGLVAYELLTAHHPFEGKAVGELIVAQMTEMPSPPSRLATIPKRLEDAIMRLLRKRKDERFPNAAALGAEFRAIAETLRAPAEMPRVSTPPATAPAWTSAPQMPSLPDAAAEVSSPSRAAVNIPGQQRREATMSPNTARIRLATRKQPRKGKGVRVSFLLAFALSGVVLGATFAGLFDVESIVGQTAVALGWTPPPPPKVRPAVPAQTDGTAAAFAAAPALLDCKGTFTRLREYDLPAASQGLRERLEGKLDLYSALESCLGARKAKLAAPVSWAAPYVAGVAAFEFAVALAHLPPRVRDEAASYTLGGDQAKTAPFNVQLFTGQAMDRLNEARGPAPDVQKAYIDNFQIEMDALKQRLTQAAITPTAASLKASP
jgi:serine/threonine protein kinase